MDFLYGRAGDPEDLPWHRDEPPALLQEVLASRSGGGRALDIGCGSGVFAVHLARQGFQVTGVDFVADAIRMSRERAAAAGVELELVEADVLAWEPRAEFDLVLDRGCLHMLDASDAPTYRDRLLGWLAPGADYVLDHFLKRHRLDWRPIGPRRWSDEQVRGLFEPELELTRHERELLQVPPPVGPRVLMGSYWFSRAAGA